MAQESGLKECSFFLVRYVPDLVRDEHLNIGLFLHSPQEKYLGCLFTDDFRRIKRFHPQADLELLRELQQHFEQEIDQEGNDLEAYLRRLRDSYSNLIQMTEPRACFLRDPQTEIQEFFVRYVGRRVGRPPAEVTRLRIKHRLTAALAQAAVWDRLEKRISAGPWTHKGDPFTFDFGYHALRVADNPDGHIKFIHAVSLKHDREVAHVLANTIRYVRQKEPADLTAVVEGLPARGDERAAHSQQVLMDAEITLQPLAGVEEYAQSVRRELAI